MVFTHTVTISLELIIVWRNLIPAWEIPRISNGICNQVFVQPDFQPPKVTALYHRNRKYKVLMASINWIVNKFARKNTDMYIIEGFGLSSWCSGIWEIPNTMANSKLSVLRKSDFVPFSNTYLPFLIFRPYSSCDEGLKPLEHSLPAKGNVKLRGYHFDPFFTFILLIFTFCWGWLYKWGFAWLLWVLNKRNSTRK